MENQINSNMMVFTLDEQTSKFIESISSNCFEFTSKKTHAQILSLLSNTICPNSLLEDKSIAKMIVVLKSDIKENQSFLEKKKDREDIFSSREIDIFREMSVGKTSREIADKLFISINTVNFHIKNIYQKLNVHTKLEAVMNGIELGLL